MDSFLLFVGNDGQLRRRRGEMSRLNSLYGQDNKDPCDELILLFTFWQQRRPDVVSTRHLQRRAYSAK